MRLSSTRRQAVHALVTAALLSLPACSRPSSEGPTATARPPPPHRGQGTIEGVARVAGALPARPPIAVAPSAQRQCGTTLPDSSLSIGPAGVVVSAVAFVDDSEPAPPDADAGMVVIDQRQCAFVPAVIAARAGATIELVNSDALLHNARAEQGTQPLFNLAMPVTGMKLTRRLPEAPGIVDMRCDVHPWMHAWVRTFPNPYFSSTDAAGKFVIPAVPSGRRTVVAWHPLLGEQRTTVEVEPGQTAHVTLEWPASALKSP